MRLQTELRYTGDLQVGGTIAAGDRRVIEGEAGKIADEFFAALAEGMKKE
jgi:carbon monoxide dehydrogenase subunit G